MRKESNQTVRMATPGQIKDVISAVVESIEVKKIFSVVSPYTDLLADWQNFYRDVFGLELDFSNLSIPEKRAGFDRLLIIAQGMTPQRLYDKCKELFPCWKWTEKSLDEIVKSRRTSKDSAYAVWLRERVEADEELKNLSAEQLDEADVPGVTLEERLVYELKFFKKTGKHLDIVNITLCSGSRYGDGYVPRVGWSDGKMNVRWYDPDNARDFLRSRQTVS